MSVTLYFNHHVPAAIAVELRRRGVDVLTAQEDGTSQVDDPPLLDRATQLGRVLVTHDTEFLREGARRQACGESFAGILSTHQDRLTIGQRVTKLELIAQTSSPEDLANQVWYLPL